MGRKVAVRYSEGDPGTPPRDKENFCQQASEQYEKLLEESEGDPRVAAGNAAQKSNTWQPDVDARDACITAPF